MLIKPRLPGRSRWKSSKSAFHSVISYSVKLRRLNSLRVPAPGLPGVCSVLTVLWLWSSACFLASRLGNAPPRAWTACGNNTPLSGQMENLRFKNSANFMLWVSWGGFWGELKQIIDVHFWLEKWLTIKKIHYSSWGPKFNSQHPHGIAHNLL